MKIIKNTIRLFLVIFSSQIFVFCSGGGDAPPACTEWKNTGTVWFSDFKLNRPTDYRDIPDYSFAHPNSYLYSLGEIFGPHPMNKKSMIKVHNDPASDCGGSRSLTIDQSNKDAGNLVGNTIKNIPVVTNFNLRPNHFTLEVYSGEHRHDKYGYGFILWTKDYPTGIIQSQLPFVATGVFKASNLVGLSVYKGNQFITIY